MPNLKAKNTNPTLQTRRPRRWVLFAMSLFVSLSMMTAPVLAKSTCGNDPSVETSLDFGCKGLGNPIIDLTFAIIRFLSIGVGIIVVASLIFAGIQYTSSAGDPQATAAALKRITNTVIALVLYILTFALLNWVIPGAFLK